MWPKLVDHYKRSGFLLCPHSKNLTGTANSEITCKNSDLFKDREIMTKGFEEHIGWEFLDKDTYKFKGLSGTEKSVIRITYWQNWRKLVNKSKLSKMQKKYAKLYFYEIHTRYYLTVVKGPSFVQTSRLVRNFFLSKVNEHLRAVISSIEPYNLTTFVHGLRSQIEINALLYKYLSDPDYHKNNLLLNENRNLVNELKTTVNVNTLVKKLKSENVDYQAVYDELSLLLHPNPSAIKFYGQAEGEPTADGTGVFTPRIKFYFNETITHTEQMSDWFSNKVMTFFLFLEEFLVNFDKLTNDFCINKIEEEHFENFTLAEFILKHEKEILKAFNEDERNRDGTQKNLNEAVSKIFKK
jgi:hypothetical protein